MGMTKALMEKVMIAKSRNLDASKSIFCCTRYGNVMASRGSVIPLFIDQIKNNKPITSDDRGGSIQSVKEKLSMKNLNPNPNNDKK